MKAISAVARRLAEALWWVMVLHEPYRYWKGEHPIEGGEVYRIGNQIVAADTGEILETIEPPNPVSE